MQTEPSLSNNVFELPKFTYHVTALQHDDPCAWTIDAPVSRSGAFDAAHEAIVNGDYKIRVEMVERNEVTGGAVSITDVTHLFWADRIEGQDAA